MSDDAHWQVEVTLVRDVLSRPENLHPNSPAYFAGAGGFRLPGPLTGREHRSYHAGPGPLGVHRMEEEWRPPLGSFQQCIEIDRPLGGLTNLEFRYAVVRKCLGQSASVADIEAGIGSMPWYSVKAFAGLDGYLVVAPAHLPSGGREAQGGSRTPALRGGPIIERFEHVVRLCFDRHLGPELRAQASQLLTPYNLSLMAAFLAAFALAQGTPVGIVLTGAAIGMLGFEALHVLDDFKNFVVKTGFPDEAGDFDEAARSLAQVIGRVGIDATLAILTRGAVRRPSPTQAPPSEPVGPSTAQTPSMVSGRSARAEPAKTDSHATKTTPDEKYSPLNPGPLADDIARTFRSATYSKTTFTSDTTLYRVISENGNPAGSYWTRVKPRGPLQSVIDSALDQSWGNTATKVVTARVPAGTVVYEGTAAAQRGLVGGGNQVYIPRFNSEWIQ